MPHVLFNGIPFRQDIRMWRECLPLDKMFDSLLICNLSPFMLKRASAIFDVEAKSYVRIPCCYGRPQMSNNNLTGCGGGVCARPSLSAEHKFTHFYLV